MEHCLTVAVLFVLLGPLCALSLSCKSSGVCQHTNSRCKLDDIGTCVDNSDKTLQRDENGYNLSGNKINTKCVVPSKPFNVKLEKLSLNYFHVSTVYVNVCVSWSVTNNNRNDTLGQYKVQLYSDGTIDAAFCVQSTETTVCLGNFPYESLDRNIIKVYPNVYDTTYDMNSLSLQRPFDNIRGCGDIRVKNKSIDCINRYGKPRGLSVRSVICNNTKILNISWDHPENAIVLPEKYYVMLSYKSGVKLGYFEVIGATDLVVSNLNASADYEARVTAYRKCSGLGSNYNKLGCGLKNKVSETFINTSCSIIHELLTTAEPLSLTIEPATHSFFTTKIIIFSITGVTVVSVVFAILLIISIRYVALKMRSLQQPIHPVQHNFRVFLFYSPSMSQEKQESLNNQIAANLAKYFSIITMDELIDGDVSRWLERTVNSVDAVLIVANENFFKDWQSLARYPELSCLESLISAAVVQNSVSKFAFISTENCLGKVCIPENLYLKLMRVFLMGSKTNQEVELYQFVTKSRMIMLETGKNYSKDSQNDKFMEIV